MRAVGKLAQWFWLALAGCSPLPAYADYLTDRHLALVREYMPAYQWAAMQTEVPLLALPDINYRESDLRLTRNVGGPFMMDMGGTRETFDERIEREEERIGRLFALIPTPTVRTSPAFAALCAAVELKAKARSPLYTRRGRLDEIALADALWGYHGRAGYHRGGDGKPTWRVSPYVNNHPQRGRRFVMRVNLHHGTTEYLDARPGTLVIFYELQRRMGENP